MVWGYTWYETGLSSLCYFVHLGGRHLGRMFSKEESCDFHEGREGVMVFG